MFRGTTRDLFDHLMEESNISRFERRNQSGNTILHEYCRTGQCYEVQALLSQEGGRRIINFQNNVRERIYSFISFMKEGCTPLHLACQHGHKDVIRVLMRNGASTSIRNREGKTPDDVMRDRANRDAGIPASAPPTSSPSSGENERGMLQRLEEEKRKLAEENSTLSQQYSALREKFKERVEEIGNLKSQLEMCEREKINALNLLNGKEEFKPRDVNEGLRRDLSSMEERKRELELEVGRLNQENSELKSKVTEKEQTLIMKTDDLRAQLQQLRSQLQAAKEELELVKSRNCSSSSSSTTTTNALNNAREQSKNPPANEIELRKTIKDQEKILAERNELIRSLQDQVAKVQDKERLLIQKDELIACLQEKIATLQSDIDDQRSSFESPLLSLSYTVRGRKKTITVDISNLREICCNHTMQISLDERDSILALSPLGFNVLMQQIDDNGNTLDDVGILQVAMTTDPRIEDSLKTRLLFGLLLMKGLRIVHEDGIIIAPSHNLHLPVLPEGTISFQSRVGPQVRKDAPDIASFCKMKAVFGLPVHQIISFILEKLKTCDPDESLIQQQYDEGGDARFFRLKSYSSVMNKLFYRGRSLTDLLAITVSDAELGPLKKKLLQKGAIHKAEDDVNGIGCLVYRFVRILTVTISGKVVDFPVFYEVVKKNYETAPVPHEQYELERLQFSLVDGEMNQLDEYGFRLTQPVLPQTTMPSTI